MKHLITLLRQARAAWNARAPRERLMLALMSVVVLVALLWSLIDWTRAERQRLATALPAAQAQLAAMRDAAAELERLKREPPRSAPSPASVAKTLESSAKARGLPIEVKPDADSIRINGTGGFDPIIEWLAEMQRDSGLRIVRLNANREGAGVRIEAELGSSEH